MKAYSLVEFNRKNITLTTKNINLQNQNYDSNFYKYPFK